MVKRMVRAARDGRISSVVDLPPTSDGVKGGTNGQGQRDPSRSTLLSRGPVVGQEAGAEQRGARDGTTTKVILPPTALDMGGEHEGEKVLEAAMTHRRQQSLSRNREQQSNSTVHTPPTHLNIPTANSLLSPNGIGQPTTPMTPGLPVLLQNRNIRTPITARTEHGQSPSGLRQEVLPSNHNTLHPYLATLSRYCPSYTPRRRSVDVGCLSIALDRATTAFESHPPLIGMATTVMDTNATATTSTTSTGLGTGTSATNMARSKTSSQTGQSTTTSTSNPTKGKKRRQTDTHSHPPENEEEQEQEGAETHLAELLSAMYCQAKMVTDVQMGEYAQ